MSTEEPSPVTVQQRAGHRPCTGTHDYKRHGRTTLFAALNTPDGRVISMRQPRHRQTE